MATLRVKDKWKYLWAVSAGRRGVVLLDSLIGICSVLLSLAFIYVSKLAIDSVTADAPGSFDVALVDPPRAGMDAAVREHLLRLRPPHILLVSCNPATLARDAASLAQDYEPLAIRPVDLFPHTPHLESVSLWQRRRGVPK